MGAAVFVRELLLLFQIHAAVGFGQKLFRIIAVFGIHGTANAERENIFAANFASGLARQSAHLLRFLAGGIGRESWGDHDEFVSAHAGDVIIFATAVFEGLGKQAQHAVALQMAEAIVNLFKAIHVGHHYGERGVVALAARQFPVKLQKERPGIGQAGQVIGGCGTFCLLVLERILDGERHLAADREQNAQVIGGEGIAFATIQRENANHSGDALQRHRQRRAQGAELRRIVQVSRFDRRVAVNDRLAIVRHPAGESLADGDAQRREKAVVIPVYIFGNQFVLALDVDGNGIVGHHRFQFHGEHGESFGQTQGSAEILAEFEQRLRFLPGGGNGR